MRKYLFRLTLVGLLGIVLSVFLLRNSIRKYWLDALDGLKIKVENFSYEMSPERSKPMSTLEKETRLIVGIGEPFKNFTPKDWQQFWNIIYGIYSEEPEPGKPSRKRQLTQNEMEQKLIEKYPMPFSYFGDAHWNEFWKIIK